MTVAVVTTSINPEPIALAAWAAEPEVSRLVVAGDANSPRELSDYVRSLPGGRYLDVAAQHEYASYKTVPLRCVQRRNFALLEALRSAREFDVTHVLVVDDDNAPTGTNWLERALARFDPTLSDLLTPQHPTWFDPGSMSTSERGVDVHARGLPYLMNRRQTRYGDYTPGLPADTHVAVFQASVLGDPDVDAIERMVNAPSVVSVDPTPTVLKPGYLAPINSQATLWRVEYAALAAVPPGLGRMDDIWGGLVAQRIIWEASGAVAFGWPAVSQVRNPHNLMHDLDAELLGYRYTERFGAALDVMQLTPGRRFDTGSSAGLLQAYRYVTQFLRTQSYVPPAALDFMMTWFLDVDRHVPEFKIKERV